MLVRIKQMRLIFLIFFCVFISSLQAQDEPEKFVLIGNMPVHKGCAKIKSKLEKQKCTEEKLTEYEKKNTVYPSGAETAKYNGYVDVEFVIGEDGSIIKDMTKVLAGFSGEDSDLFNQEAIRVVNSLPTLIPAFTDDQFHRVKFTRSVYFNRK